MTTYQPRPWNPAGGTHKTGRMFFTDMEGNFLSEFHVGDLRPDPGPTEYCSAHMGMAVMGIKRDLLVNAWYTGGVDVIDFSAADAPEGDRVLRPAAGLGHLVRLPVHGPDVQDGARASRSTPPTASRTTPSREGMVVYRAILPKPGGRRSWTT